MFLSKSEFREFIENLADKAVSVFQVCTVNNFIWLSFTYFRAVLVPPSSVYHKTGIRRQVFRIQDLVAKSESFVPIRSICDRSQRLETLQTTDIFLYRLNTPFFARSILSVSPIWPKKCSALVNRLGAKSRTFQQNFRGTFVIRKH